MKAIHEKVYGKVIRNSSDLGKNIPLKTLPAAPGINTSISIIKLNIAEITLLGIPPNSF